MARSDWTPGLDAEVINAARGLMARTVEDVLARRTRALLLDAKGSAQLAPAVARVLARELGRDDAWVARETASFTALARRYEPEP